MYIEYNPNPLNKRIGDCAVRAITKALNTDWDKAYLMLIQKGYQMADLPSSDSVWGNVLRENGFSREIIPNTCPECYTAKDFCEEHPLGTYVLAFGGHVATVHDGSLYDSWNSLDENPQYFYYRKEV